MKAAYVLTNRASAAAQLSEACGFLQAHPQLDDVEFWSLSGPRVAEEALPALVRQIEERKPHIVLFGSDSMGASLAVRTAFRAGGSSCVGAEHVDTNESQCIVTKHVYSNNLMGRFALKKQPYCLSIAKGFSGKERLPDASEEISCEPKPQWLISAQIKQTEQSESLGDAPCVIAAGKGVGGKEPMETLETLAKLLGGKLGGSRPVVLNAWLGMERLIGASGMILSSDLCIVVGASGAAAFTAGIEACKHIVAINSDPSAPIFQIADVGIVGDYKPVIQALTETIENATENR